MGGGWRSEDVESNILVGRCTAEAADASLTERRLSVKMSSVMRAVYALSDILGNIDVGQTNADLSWWQTAALAGVSPRVYIDCSAV